MTERRSAAAGRPARPVGPRPAAPLRLGPLGRRLLGAFVAVAAVAVVLVAAAALVGTSRGLSTDEQARRTAVANRVASAVTQAYEHAGGWSGIDLSGATTAASTAGAHLVVRDVDGSVVADGGGPAGMGQGMGLGAGGMGQGPAATGVGSSSTSVTVAVTSAARTVGSVTLGFGRVVGATGKDVAWAWIGAAAVVASLIALALGYWISRLLTRPVVSLTQAARAFAAGDRQARPQVLGHGELAELAVAFDEAATTVSRSEEVRRQMAADVAHELRTPLAALQAELEELRDGLVPADPVALARLHDQSLRLARVVDDLAELSSAEASVLGMHVGPVDLTALVSSEVAAREAQLRAAGLVVNRQLHPGAAVRGDEVRLRQVVGNLLQNCARHCREGDSVAVELGPTAAPPGAPGAPPTPGASGRAAASGWRLTVRDTGPGIPPEDLPHVFTRFWRGGAAGSARSAVAQAPGAVGSGLGLAVVQALVNAHGGRVAVDSDGVRGTTVTVDLPAAALSSDEAQF